jgi:hypothetical protein
MAQQIHLSFSYLEASGNFRAASSDSAMEVLVLGTVFYIGFG